MRAPAIIVAKMGMAKFDVVSSEMPGGSWASPAPVPDYCVAHSDDASGWIVASALIPIVWPFDVAAS